MNLVIVSCLAATIILDMSHRRLLTVFLPLLVFPSLVYVSRHFIRQAFPALGELSAICNPDFALHPYRLAYTGNNNLDGFLCGAGVFFHTFMDPAYRPFLAMLFPVVGVVALIPFLEDARNHRPFCLSMPFAVAIGVLFQKYSMAVIFPIYDLVLVITGTASIQPSVTPRTQIKQANAEALLFGLVVGYVLPTILMVFLDRPYPIAVWQGFPIIIAFAILVHRFIRPPSRYVQSGHSTVITTLASSFIVSALLHAVYVWPIITDYDMLRTQFVPVAGVHDPAAMSLTDGVVVVIKWDLIFGIVSIILPTFWMADSLFSLGGIICWYSVAIIAVGPAAATIGVLLWRERRLNGQTRAISSPRKMR